MASALKSLIALLENQSADVILNEETENLWSSLMFLIGNKLCNKRVYNDGLAICKHYKNVDFLIDQDVDNYIQDRNRLLVLFLSGLIGLDIETVTTEKKLAFANTIEMCYHCLLYTSPSPRDGLLSRMPSSA